MFTPIELSVSDLIAAANGTKVPRSILVAICLNEEYTGCSTSLSSFLKTITHEIVNDGMCMKGHDYFIFIIFSVFPYLLPK